MDKRRYIIVFVMLLGIQSLILAQNKQIPRNVSIIANKSNRYVYNINDYGANNDTTCTSTKAIQDAIDECSLNGGGRVVIPAGTYKSGTIVLKDNVELHLSNGAILKASRNAEDFIIFPHTEYRSLKDIGGWASLIYADGAKNISITGNGTIDGDGKGIRGMIRNVSGDCNGRPRNILLISCANVRVSDVTIRNAAMWNQHYLNCDDVMVANIRSWNHCNGNNDGVDIDGCRRFILSSSIIDSDDDGIVLKSTGLAPCEDVIVTGCTVSSFANAIKLGTESTGGYKNILISDCVVKPSANKGDRVIKSTPSGISAISLEEVDGGVMDGVTVNNILIDGTECPLFIRLGNRGRKHIAEAPVPPIGTIRNIRISNVTAYHTGNFGSSITGIWDKKIENVSLSDIRIVNRGGLKKGAYRLKDADYGMRHDMAGNVFADKYWIGEKDVKEDDKGYPQPTVWGNLPSYGLFIRHVKNVKMNNVTFESEVEDPRKPLIAVDVDNIE